MIPGFWIRLLAFVTCVTCIEQLVTELISGDLRAAPYFAVAGFASLAIFAVSTWDRNK